jgi:hypothetical protein
MHFHWVLLHKLLPSGTFRIPNYPCDWRRATKAFYAVAWHIGWLSTRSWRLQSLSACRSRLLPFLLPWSTVTNNN